MKMPKTFFSQFNRSSSALHEHVILNTSDIDIDLTHGSIVFDVVCMEGTKCMLF
jgi:hypothetical protein